MGLSAAERNRRKRERKKREREERQKQEQKQNENENDASAGKSDDVEIEYIVEPVVAANTDHVVSTKKDVPEGVPSDGQQQPEEDGMESVLRRFQERAAVSVVTDDDTTKQNEDAKATKKEKNDEESDNEDSDDDSDDEGQKISKRKLREMIRPSVAELKRHVKRPDLVEAHDVTAFDPNFLIQVRITKQEEFFFCSMISTFFS